MDVLKFKLEITLGNDAMQTSDDVSRLLRDLGSYLAGSPSAFDYLADGETQPLRDANGNSVGYWEVTS